MKRFRSIAMASLLAASAASTAFASFMPAVPGKAEPQGLRWKDRVVRIAVSRSVIDQNSNIKADSDVLGAIRSSISAWEKVAGVKIELELTDRSNVSPSGISGDGVSLITIAESPENVALFAKDPLAESAKTRVFYNRKNFITEADIVLNPFQQFSTDGTFGTFDLESTLTHEIGHLLGLRHSGVLGSTMSGSLPKNGTFGIADLTARTLSESDIAAIRELYGVETANQDCCSAIVGKLNAGPSRSLRGTSVWAEDSTTGKVVGMSEVSPDGAFRLGGLPEGSYTVFWQKRDELGSPLGSIGTYKLAKDETRLISEKITIGRSSISIDYVGINGQLSDTSVSLAAGREFTVLLGGKNVDGQKLAIEFNSPYITLVPNSIKPQDFGDGISVVSFIVSIHEGTPAGSYSVFATGEDGAMHSLIGALNIQ
ncbi:MAG: matrixin family metalloprotease [Pyrinomonadaceae bacterium]